MFRRFKVMMFVIIAVTGIIGFNATNASAESSNNKVITSAYDDQSSDNLTLAVMASDAFCKGSTWVSDVQIANTSQNTDVDISFVPNTGGTLPPGETASYRYSSNGTNALEATFEFAFSVKTAGEETGSISIPAPSGGCGTSSEVQCYLNNFTPRDTVNPDGTYKVGSPINLEADLVDQQATVKHYVFSFMRTGNSKSNEIISGENPAITWTPAVAGEWRVVVQLFDANGKEVIPTGDPDVVLTVVSAQAVTPTPPSTVPPTTAVDTSSNAGSGTTNIPTSVEVLGTTSDNNTASADTLPVTGARTTFLVTLSLVLIMLGIGFVLLGKREKPLIDPDWERFLNME